MIVLGIDPGLRVTGYGAIEVKDGSFKLVEAGFIRTRSEAKIGSRLSTLYRSCQELLSDVKPDLVVLEKLFSHIKHPTTSLLMGHARGVICLACHEAGIPLVNLPSTRVKKSIVSNGHASKTQIQMAVRHYLRLKKPPAPEDVSDALAIALSYAFMNSSSSKIPLKAFVS